MENVQIGYCQHLACWQQDPCNQHKPTQDAADSVGAIVTSDDNRLFERLPNDAGFQIFNYFNTRELIATATVCRDWQMNPVLKTGRGWAAMRLQVVLRNEQILSELTGLQDAAQRAIRRTREQIEMSNYLILANQEALEQAQGNRCSFGRAATITVIAAGIILYLTS